MTEAITLTVNGVLYPLTVDPETPLLYILRNDLGLKGPKFGCGLEQCYACKVLIDGADVPSCKLPVEQAQGTQITTIEGLGTPDALHPLQEAFMAEQAIQCGYCVSGMIIAAQGLLNRTRYPTDEEIRTALDGNLCRCGVYDRVRRAIKLRIGRPVWEPIYEVVAAPPLATPPPAQAMLPAPLQQTPDLDAWIRIDATDTVTVFTGKVEIGQGLKTAIAQLAAEELDVTLDRIRVIMADTALTPNEGVTAGSMSLETSGNAVRQAAAEARHILLQLAHEELEVDGKPEELMVQDGTVTDPATGRQTTYWALFGGQRFGRQATGLVKPKAFAAHAVVGQAATRLDLPAKVTGLPSFVHDLTLPGMVHGRIVRPPAYAARLVTVDDAAVKQMPGVLAVVRDGSFLGVIAEREEQAIAAREALQTAAVWENTTQMPPPDKLYDHLRSQPAQSQLLIDGALTNDPIPPITTPTNAAQTLNATYYRPYQMHASIGPSAAVAQWADGQLTLWSHTQGAYPLRAALAQVLKLDAAQIRVTHMEGAGCYGHNGADDVGLDAALLARAYPGRPISLKWMRDDEHAWEPYGPAMTVQLQASLDTNRAISDWNEDIWSYPHSGRPRPGTDTSGLLAAWHLAEPFPPPVNRLMPGRHSGSFRNSDPLYAFPQRRVVNHHVDNSPLRTSSMRSLGAYANIFAIESFMDELALAAGIDPVAFRLQHLTNERAKAVIEAAAQKIGWQPKAKPNNNGRGQGIAFAQYKNLQCYAAIAVEVTVDRESGQIAVPHAVIAADAGQVVNPDGLSNQLEGGFVQALSWTLLEEVSFDQTGVTSRDWESYPILRFTAAPVIETVLLNRPDLPFLGSGEASQNPTPAAVANAVFDAIGVRLRQIPFTPERVRAAMVQG
jgi:CO/xanthine dehydrogenase Mo-binding subunit/aerobic-type carbon monoxide dehydrogenase small subunit (CoxS/CutS family)